MYVCICIVRYVCWYVNNLTDCMSIGKVAACDVLYFSIIDDDMLCINLFICYKSGVSLVTLLFIFFYPVIYYSFFKIFSAANHQFF